MAAALAAGRRATSVLAGALGALAAAFKLAFVIPALAIVLLAKDVRRADAGFAVAALGLVVVFGLLFGEPLWTNVVRAQAQTGRASFEHVAGLWSQAGWNLLPLVVLAALGWSRRSASADPDLARSLLAASLGSLLLLATLVKHGSYLTVVVVAEPPLLCLAACAVAATLRERSRARTVSSRPRSRWRSCRSHRSSSRPRTRARSRARRRGLVSRVVAAADRGSQPDQFIVGAAPILAEFRRTVEAEPAICPGRLPAR